MKSARACPAAAGVGQWKPLGGSTAPRAPALLPRWCSALGISGGSASSTHPPSAVDLTSDSLRCHGPASDAVGLMRTSGSLPGGCGAQLRAVHSQKLDGPKLARALHGHGESLHRRTSNPPLRSISIPSRSRVTGQVARANPWKGAHRGLAPFQCAGFFAYPVQTTPHASGSQAASSADRLLLPAPVGNAAVTALGFTLSAQSANSNCVGAGIVICVRAGVLHASRCLQQRNIKFKARAGARERSGTGGRRKGHHPLHARDASPSHKGRRERILVARGGGRHRVTARCRVAGG